jgi:hypothetical protein
LQNGNARRVRYPGYEFLGHGAQHRYKTS